MLRNHKRRTQQAWILRMSPTRLSSSIYRFNINCEVKDFEKGALIREFTLPFYYFNDPEADYPIRSGSLLFYQSTTGKALFLFDIKTDWLPQQLPSPCLSPTLLDTYGFGYSYKSSKYKVVRLCCTSRWSPSYDVMSCEVYSAPKADAAFGSWRQISEECPCCVWGNGVVANNMVHWISRESVRFALVSFDLDEEIFTTMPFSDLEQYRTHASRLAKLKGRLCWVNQPISERDIMSLRVWALKDYGEGTWECWCNISLAGLVYGDARRFKTFGVAYVGDEELVFVARIRKDDYREVYCDMREGGRITRLVKIAYGPIILCGKTRI